MITTFLSEFTKYWDTLCEFINPYTVLIWGVVGAVIAFIVALIFTIKLRKKILVPRKYVILKVLSYCYMAFFPLFIGFYAFQWSALHNCERQVVKNIPKYLGESNHLFNKYVKTEAIKIIGEETMNSSGNELLNKAVSGIQSVSKSLFKSTANEQLVSEKTGISDAAFSYISSVLVETGFVRKYVVGEIKKKVGDVLLMDKKLTDEFFDTEITKIMDTGILNTVVEKHVKNITGSFKMNVLLMFLLIMAILVIEIIIANRVHKP
ncbi:hypothetical protein [Bacteroides sp. 519]|uniref:hypothetical protein n=1 Tax=Bacteroides sp. 519 TaxID=2302937 RepID=UPI0013D6C471|nr:hypothetical protein [Bacteroides sp. 519]NDV59134.1 hypothetical protein [Bacteroides sp. 519]